MRILVTGGAGYIGSHTVRVLRARGHHVWVYDNLSVGHRAAVPAESLIVGDLRDADLLDQVLLSRRIEAVVHFAASASVGESVTHPAKYYQNNVVHTLTLLERMRRHGIGRIVFSSTCATYGIPAVVPITEATPQQPINPYGRTKWMIEHAIRDYAAAYGWSGTILRYFNAAGASPEGDIGEDHRPEGHLIPLVLQVALGQRPHIEIFGTDYPTPDGTCIRDYIHVDDLAEAHALALEAMPAGQVGAFNLGIGQGYSVRTVIQTVEALTGRRIAVRESARRDGDPAELVAAPHHAMKELGWKPRYMELAPIVETAWHWHRRHPKGFDSAPLT
jgi:UDP-glucose-4-epimerase GalE